MIADSKWRVNLWKLILNSMRATGRAHTYILVRVGRHRSLRTGALGAGALRSMKLRRGGVGLEGAANPLVHLIAVGAEDLDRASVADVASAAVGSQHGIISSTVARCSREFAQKPRWRTGEVVTGLPRRIILLRNLVLKTWRFWRKVGWVPVMLAGIQQSYVQITCCRVISPSMNFR